MISKRFAAIFFLAGLFLIQGCSTTDKKKDVSASTGADSPVTEVPAVAKSDQTEPIQPEIAKIESLKTDPPPQQKKSRKKRGRFHFSGDEFIKETGGNPFTGKSDTIMRLKGHARVNSQNVKMVAPLIEIYGDDGDMAYAKGPVEIYDTKSDTRINGNEALFFRNENRAVVRGNTRLVSKVKGKNKKKSKDKVNLNANELERNFDTSISIARGQVVATTKDSVMYADQAEYNEPIDMMHSNANPRIFTATDVFLADDMQWNVAKNIADFHGHVKAYLSRKDDEKKKKPVASAVRSEEGTLTQDEDLPFGQKLNLRRKVQFEREKYSGYSEEADIFGPGGEWVKARDSVVLINKEDNTTSYGDTFEWLKSSGAMVLAALPQKQTRTLLFNKMNRQTAEIKAKTLNRSSEKARPQARGDVRIIQFPKDPTATPAKMGSEWAEIRREEKVIQLNGSPYVDGKMGKIGAREIILYYEEERYEMLGIMPGIVDKQIADKEEEK